MFQSNEGMDRRSRESLKAEIMAELRSEMNSRNNRRPRKLLAGRLPQREPDQATIEALERLLAAEKARRETSLNDLEAVRDPYARRLVERMLRQDQRKEISLAELIDLLNTYPEMGRMGYFKRQLQYTLGSPEGRSFLYGAGSVLLALLLLPTLKEKTRGLLVSIIQGTAKLSEQATELVSGIKEDLEDIVAEAQFENLKKSIDQAVGSDGASGKS